MNLVGRNGENLVAERHNCRKRRYFWKRVRAAPNHEARRTEGDGRSGYSERCSTWRERRTGYDDSIAIIAGAGESKAADLKGPGCCCGRLCGQRKRRSTDHDIRGSERYRCARDRNGWGARRQGLP